MSDATCCGGGCGGDAENTVSAAAATLPLDSIRYLIGVVKGDTPFEFAKAAVAVAAVIKYLGEFFGGSISTASVASDDAKTLLGALATANGDVLPAAIGDRITKLLMEQLLKWFMGKLAGI